MKTSLNTRSKSTISLLAAGFVALGFATIGGNVHAAEPQQALTRVVAYGDLNLDSEQGAKVLYARLRQAAQSVCVPFEGRDLNQKSQWRSCYGNALGSAVVRVNKVSVTALHNQDVNHAFKS